MTLREFAEDLLHRLVNNPFAMLYAGLGIVGTVWGAVVIYQELVEAVPKAWALPLQIGIFTLLVCPAIGWWMTSYRHRYGIPLARDYIFPLMRKTWRIDAHGSAHITTATTYYFLRDPRQDELVDTMFGSAPLSLAQLDYNSPDSTSRDYAAVTSRRHLIYWQPREGVEAGVPYIHTVVAHYPYLNSAPPRVKSLTLAPHARTLRLEVTVESELPISDAIAYCGYRFQRNADAKAISDRAKRIRHRRAPLPTVTTHGVEWAMDDAEAGSTYYLVLFFHQPAPVEGNAGTHLADAAPA